MLSLLFGRHIGRIMKFLTVFIISIVLSVSVAAEDSVWPLIPELAEQLQQNNAEDIHIGSFYYYYLNEDYQSAYNQLSQLRANNQVNTTTLNVLESTLLLALGLEDKALSVFQSIDQKSAAVPAKAWLYLARRLQVLGNWPLADAAAKTAYDSKTRPLAHIEAQEALHILVQCAAEQEDTRSANLYFNLMAERGKWSDYARYNLLVGSIEGYASIYEIDRQVKNAAFFIGESEENLALLDRMFLLGGVYMMGEGRFKNAENFLKQVRQDGPYAAPALLEYGWSRLEQSRFEDALQPWRVLQAKYENWHPAVIESVLAIPYTMEKMNATTQALYGYERVEKRLVVMLAELKEQQQASSISQWLEQWLTEQQGQWGWRRHNNIIDQAKPMSRNLMSLLASSSVRAQLDDLHDLKRMQQDLSNQLQQLDYWQETANSRQQYLRSVDGARRLQLLEQRYQRLQLIVDDLENQWQQEQKSALAFAGQAQQVQINRVKNAVPLIKSLKENAAADVDLIGYMERWRRVRGVLVWQMNEERPERERVVGLEIRQLREQLALLNIQLNHSQIALSGSVTGWQGYTARIAQAKQKIQSLQQGISLLEQHQQQQIIASVQNDLLQQQQKLTQYLAQARLALARLYDDHLQRSLASAGGEQ